MDTTIKPLPTARGGTKVKNLTGKKYYKLTVVGYLGQVSGQNGSMWLCRCECGREMARSAAYLKTRGRHTANACDACRPGRSAMSTKPRQKRKQDPASPDRPLTVEEGGYRYGKDFAGGQAATYLKRLDHEGLQLLRLRVQEYDGQYERELADRKTGELTHAEHESQWHWYHPSCRWCLIELIDLVWRYQNKPHVMEGRPSRPRQAKASCACDLCFDRRSLQAGQVQSFDMDWWGGRRSVKDGPSGFSYSDY